jgi:hypothetical protein
VKAKTAKRRKTTAAVAEALQVLERAWERKCQHLVGLHWAQWMTVIEWLREQEREAAARRIQRVARCFACRLLLRRLRSEAAAAREQSPAVLSYEETRHAAIEIQRVLRGWRYGRVMLRRSRVEDKAARAIQRYIRRIIAKREAWSVRYMHVSSEDMWCMCLPRALLFWDLHPGN